MVFYGDSGFFHHYNLAETLLKVALSTIKSNELHTYITENWSEGRTHQYFNNIMVDMYIRVGNMSTI